MVSLISLLTSSQWVDGFMYIDMRGENLFVQEGMSELVEKMEMVENNPSIIVRVSESTNPSSFLFPSGDRSWQVSASDEISIDGVRLQKLGENVVVDTNQFIEKNGKWKTERQDWLKNALLPWQLDKITYTINHEGTFKNLEIDMYLSENLRFENLDFVFVWKSTLHSPEFSPWGPIQFVIVLGALIYVIKR